jgi:FAD/FMN-containing dehydrogenase
MRTHPAAGAVVTPADPDYDTARRIWNARFDCRPSAIVYPGTPAEVGAAIGYARDAGLPFRIRSGGHNVEGFCVLDDGVVIDLSRLTGLSVTGDSARIEPGVHLGDVYTGLGAAGVTIPAGVCPDIRIGGHVLGGGVGMLVRSRGMLVDSLTGLTMVDADGRVLDVDDVTHPELMWACRGGGGGNFGIVTAYTFRTAPVTDVTLVSARWDWADGTAVLDAWQHWVPTADPRVNTRFSLYPGSVGTVQMTALFEGPAADWEAAVSPLTSRFRPVEYSAETVPYLDTVGRFADRVPTIRAKFVPALTRGPLPAEALAVLERRHRDAPPGVKTGIYGLGGRVLDPAAAQRSAFAHRDALFCVEYLGHWPDPARDAEHLAWLTGLRDEMLEFTTGGAYVNSPDRDLGNHLHAYYGENLPRLMAVKRRYDPANVFSFEQSIPPALTAGQARAAGLSDSVLAGLRDRDLLES